MDVDVFKKIDIYGDMETNNKAQKFQSPKNRYIIL